jgi:hypothetical protein
VPGSVSPTTQTGGAARPIVLVLDNDFSLAAAKTSRHLALALDRLGFTAIVRDTRLTRWAAGEVANESGMRREAYEVAVVAKWAKLVKDYGIDAVISLDLHWLFSSRLFLNPDDPVKQVHSFWFDDLRSHLLAAPMFALDPREAMNAPKVTHHCYGEGQAEELRLLGVARIRRSALAAPSDYLRADEPCLHRDKLAFVGNPGLPTPPGAKALAAMDRGASLAELRAIARQELLDDMPHTEPTAGWLRQAPLVRDLLAAAMERRLAATHVSAVSLLVQAGREFPEAFDFLNRGGLILDAALLVKLVNRYDRPGLVRRIWKRGWLDVYGTPEQWKPFGIDARPTVPFPRLASVYRRYAAHLNAANCARDAAANEKLFEIAACARLSLNLDSPDVRACYPDGEVVLAPDEQALEAEAEKFLRDPDAALAAGDKARARTAREHLWENRLEKAFA